MGYQVLWVTRTYGLRGLRLYLTHLRGVGFGSVLIHPQVGVGESEDDQCSVVWPGKGLQLALEDYRITKALQPERAVSLSC